MEQQEIVVVGAGLIGLATAWSLRQRGRQVLLLERHGAVAEETSHANAGMLTPSMADPWNSPGIAGQLLRWLGREQSPMLLRPRALPHYFSWGVQFLRHSRPDRHQRATLANFALADFSRECFAALRKQQEWPYDLRLNGTLQVFRQAAELDRARALIDTLAERGLRARVLETGQLSALEPSLAPVADQFVGGVHYQDDETGDARRYCQGLAQALIAAGGELRLNCTVNAVTPRTDGLGVRLDTEAGRIEAEHAVVCAAGHSRGLLRPLGLCPAIAPVKGYSLTLPWPAGEPRPQRSIIDHHLHAAITPLDDRLRMAGTAEFSGWDPCLRPGRLQALRDLLARVLPDVDARIDHAAAEAWCGFRPMSADGIPHIGPTPVPGLWLNSGHGHLGWTQSLGSGELLSALLCRETPPIDPQPYQPR